jgi:predicted ATP-grasp superfamily ATP-dependent carboligase
VRVFVWEYLTSGACTGEPIADSLVREGAAMLTALLRDVQAIDGCTAVTVWDNRLGTLDLPGVEIAAPGDGDEREQYRRLARECDRTFLVAPEFAGILAQRRRWIDDAGGRCIGCTVPAIELCADKLRLAAHLTERGLRTPETVLLGGDPVSLGEIRGLTPPARLDRFPTVVKPRDGAGSQSTYLVENADELRRLDLSTRGWPAEFIAQPFIAGQAVSMAALVAEGGRQVSLLPMAAQRLSADGRFTYLGGEAPTLRDAARDTAPAVAVEQLVRRAIAVVPGLEGYVGFDLVLPTAAPLEPVLIEINPRLTTSYVGYRRLAEDNLAQQMLFPSRCTAAIRWRPGRVTFQPDGTTRYE